MIKTFTAYTAQDALAMVDRELGAHAVVLHTRNLKRGGFLGIGARAVVEITAADGRSLGRERRKEAQRSPRAEALRQAREARPTTPTSADPPPMAGDLIRRTYQAARAQFNGPDGFCAMPADPDAAAPPSPATTTSEPSVVAITPPPTRDDAMLSRELAAVKHLVQQVARHQELGQIREATPGLPDPLVEHYATLIEQEVAADLAREMVSTLDPDAAPEQTRLALLDALARHIPGNPDGGDLTPTPDGRPRTIALVGPTGVGKTTTVAKLAANYLLKQNKRVGLITADTFRIAAVEQLRTYAGIIGLPLEVVRGPGELRVAIDRLSDRDVILIDTAGRSQRDAGRLDELASLLQVAKPHETHLVLAATASQKVLLQVVERFGQIETDRLIFTKLDEAVACGVLLNVVRQVGKPLSYITTGQEVPHQIEPGDPRRLAELILGAEVSTP